MAPQGLRRADSTKARQRWAAGCACSGVAWWLDLAAAGGAPGPAQCRPPAGADGSGVGRR
eukprot:13795358-Alexandrium_andersonii.AAC.1